jgi:hypothetical protein
VNKKTLKITGYSIFSVAIASVLFVTLDYFEVFGTTIEKRLSFTEVRFRTINAETGGVILNAGVRCFQKTNNNSCTLKDSHQVSVVSVNVPIQKAVKKTLLFKKAEEIYKSIDPEINIMIIHNDYYKQTVKMEMEELYANSVIEKTIEMSLVEQSDSDLEEVEEGVETNE